MVRVGVSEFGMEILKHIKSGTALLSDSFDVVVEVVNFRVHSASKNVGLVVEGSPSWQAVQTVLKFLQPFASLSK